MQSIACLATVFPSITHYATLHVVTVEKTLAVHLLPHSFPSLEKHASTGERATQGPNLKYKIVPFNGGNLHDGLCYVFL